MFDEDEADVACLMTPLVSQLPSDVSIVGEHNELSANNENNDNTISRHHDNHISHQPGSVSALLRDTPHWSVVRHRRIDDLKQVVKWKTYTYTYLLTYTMKVPYYTLYSSIFSVGNTPNVHTVSAAC